MDQDRHTERRRSRTQKEVKLPDYLESDFSARRKARDNNQIRLGQESHAQYTRLKDVYIDYENEYIGRRANAITEHNQFVGDDEQKGEYYMASTAGLLPKYHRELRDPALNCEESSYRHARAREAHLTKYPFSYVDADAATEHGHFAKSAYITHGEALKEYNSHVLYASNPENPARDLYDQEVPAGWKPVDGFDGPAPPERFYATGRVSTLALRPPGEKISIDMKTKPKSTQAKLPSARRPIAGFEHEPSQVSHSDNIREIKPRSKRGYTNEESYSSSLQPLTSSYEQAPSRSDIPAKYRRDEISETRPRSTHETSAPEPRTSRFQPVSDPYGQAPSRGGHSSSVGRSEIQEIRPRSSREPSGQEPRTSRFQPVSDPYGQTPSRGGHSSSVGSSDIREIAPRRPDVQEIKPREKLGFSFGKKKK